MIAPPDSGMGDPRLPERPRLRESHVIVMSLATTVALCSVYLLLGAGTGMSTLGMIRATGPGGALLAGVNALGVPAPWTLATAVVMVVMWWLMMVAMMLPSAAPAVLLYAALSRGSDGRASWNTGLFGMGYLLVWAGFSIVATLLQWGMTTRGALSPMYMTLTSGFAGGFVLILAGLYQLTPLKRMCLEACRGPVQSLLSQWRPGPAGALRAGMGLGVNCLGCCWVLMLLLFVGGVMNLYWIIGIAAYVGIEKLAPPGPRLAGYMGGLLILAGLLLLARQTGVMPG